MMTNKEERAKRISLIAILVLGMLSAFGPVCTDIYLPAIPNITQEFGVSASQIQLSLTATFLGLALGQIIIGPLSDAYGRKKPLLICLFIFILSSLACSLSTNIVELLLFRTLQGLSGAAGVVLSRSIACDLYQGSHLTEFMAILMAINSIAPIISPIIGSFILQFFTWPALFVFLMLWGVFLFVSSYFFIKESLAQENRHAHALSAIKDMFLQLTNQKFLLICLTCATTLGAFIGYLSSSPFIFQNIYGLSSLAYALVFALNASAMTIGSQLVVRLIKRYKEQILFVFAITSQMICGLLLLVIITLEPQSFIYTTIVFCIFTFSISMSQTVGFTLAMGARVGAAGSASGIFGVLNFLIGATISPVVGILGEYSMLPQALLMLVCPVIAIILWTISRRI